MSPEAVTDDLGSAGSSPTPTGRVWRCSGCGAVLVMASFGMDTADFMIAGPDTVTDYHQITDWPEGERNKPLLDRVEHDARWDEEDADSECAE